MDAIATIGLDIATTSFAAHCAAAFGKEVKKAQTKRRRCCRFSLALRRPPHHRN